MIINNIDILKLNRPFLIAEAGSTHQGNQELALKMATIAVKSGADALTFQEIDETKLYTVLEELPVMAQPRVGWECLKECRKIVKKSNLAFSVCVTDLDSLEDAMKVGIDFIKIVSYDVTFFPFLKHCGETGLPVLMSTGASTFDEVEKAIKAINALDRLLLYHTDCGYPTKDHEVNLLRMRSLKEKFKLPVGYCDHTDHGFSCLAATTLGANVIEKHFIVDRKLEGADYMVALEPDEIKELFDNIKRIAKISGSGTDKIEEGDLFRRNNLRRSVAIKRDMKKGEIIKENDLTMLRPPIGLKWDEINKIIGKKVKKNLQNRHIIKIDDID